MTKTVYIEPNGTQHDSLPEIWQNSSPITWSFLQSKGWTKEERQIPVTVQDYDDAMQEHLKEQRVARGYTVREPDVYMDSTNERWHQDAVDWVTHRDAVMTYGLQVQNRYIAGQEVPTLQEFKQNMPKIEWTLQLT